MSRQQITKGQIERKLKRPVPNWVWEYAQKERWVSEASSDLFDEAEPVVWLVNRIGRLIDAAARAATQQIAEGFVRKRRQRRIALQPLRRETISTLIANVARRRPDVRWFRKKVLGGRLLEWEGVTTWIEDHLAESTQKHAVVVQVPDHIIPRINDQGRVDLPAGALDGMPIESRLPPKDLEYSVPGSRWVKRQPIGREGALSQLQSLAEVLAALFRWQEAQAAVFVLTDQTPSLSALSTSFKPGPATSIDSEAMLQLTCLTRLTFTVDLAVIPEELAEVYKNLRADLLKKNLRSLSKKNMLLVTFCDNDEKLTSSIMKAWNQEYPEWRYERFSNFSRDAREAKDCLLFPEINCREFYS